jgi:hypothetical protein
MGRIRSAAFGLSLLCASSVLFASCGCIPAIEACDSIVLDMPHGGRWIAVEPDGSGTYSYGALPAFGTFDAGTFEFEELYNELRAVVERRPRDTAETCGTVQFYTSRGSGGESFFVYDHELLMGLLNTAFDNRVEPTEVWEIDAVRRLNEIWLAEGEAP